MRVLVTGSRDWEHKDVIFGQLNLHWETSSGPFVLVHGDCPSGADAMAQEWVDNMNRGAWQVTDDGVLIEVERHPAEWDKYGKAAGFRRNAEMVNLGADVCLAFIKNESKGASHTARLAEQAGIPTARFTA